LQLDTHAVLGEQAPLLGHLPREPPGPGAEPDGDRRTLRGRRRRTPRHHEKDEAQQYGATGNGHVQLLIGARSGAAAGDVAAGRCALYRRSGPKHSRTVLDLDLPVRNVEFTLQLRQPKHPGGKITRSPTPRRTGVMLPFRRPPRLSVV